MRVWTQFGLTALLGGALAVASFGQSLADAARQEQARKAATPPPQHVYTNEDFPPRVPDSAHDEEEDKAGKSAETKSSEKEKKPTADELRAKILAQKQQMHQLEDHIADLQRQLDDWNNTNGSNVGYFGKGGTANCGQYYNNPYEDWCNIPAKLQADYKKSKTQLDDAQHALEEMQEEARRAGFRSNVYDPD